jgi:uncharacterized iron-regulated membrane protein
VGPRHFSETPSTRLRSVLFWIHLIAGTIAGVVILVMSVTGTLLTFQQSVLQIVERSQRFVAVPSGAARLGVDVLLERVRAASPDAQPTTLTLTSNPAASVAVALGTQGTLFVNIYGRDHSSAVAPRRTSVLLDIRS